MVAPSGTPKPATALLTPNLSVSVRIVTGIVAFELAVDSENKICSWVFSRKVFAEIGVNKLTEYGYTIKIHINNNVKISTKYSTTLTKISGSKVAPNLNIRANTPYGAKLITTEIKRIMILLAV